MSSGVVELFPLYDFYVQRIKSMNEKTRMDVRRPRGV